MLLRGIIIDAGAVTMSTSYAFDLKRSLRRGFRDAGRSMPAAPPWSSWPPPSC
jgi:hypothetical protein